MNFVMVARVVTRSPSTKSRVLPGSKLNAGGHGPGLRYRQPQNLSYHFGVTTLQVPVDFREFFANGAF